MKRNTAVTVAVVATVLALMGMMMWEKGVPRDKGIEAFSTIPARVHTPRKPIRLNSEQRTKRLFRFESNLMKNWTEWKQSDAKNRRESCAINTHKCKFPKKYLRRFYYAEKAQYCHYVKWFCENPEKEYGEDEWPPVDKNIPAFY